MNDYYVYAYLREDGTPYYIGKGKGRRANQSNGRRFKIPPKDRIKILLDNLTEEQAFANEFDFIKWYGRKDNNTGILRNLTDGGEGISGKIFSPEQRKRLSDSHKGYVPSEEARRKNGMAHKGKFVSEETRKKQSLSLKGLKRSEDVKQRLKQLAKRGEENPNYGKKRPESINKKAWETRTEKIKNNPENIKAKGYTWVKIKNKWKAVIRFKGKDYFLGYHMTQEDARKAYLEGVKKLYNTENDISSGTGLEKNLGIANT
jgi:hypothetical protein